MVDTCKEEMELSISRVDKLLVMDQIVWESWCNCILKYIREDNSGFCTEQKKAGKDGWHSARNKNSEEDDIYSQFLISYIFLVYLFFDN